MTIKHIVLCGGGPVGFPCYGVLKKLTQENIISFNNIKTIYATSIGAFIAIIYILNMEWEWIDDFLIKRPWDKLLNFTSHDYLNILHSKGLIDENIIIDILKPLLLANDLDINITLKDFYEHSNIELHIFTSNLNKFCKVDLNHKTYPSLKLYDAVMMTCSIPIMVKPPYYNDEYYLDGGIFCNTPLNECYSNEKCEKNEILAMVNDRRFSNGYMTYDSSNNDNSNISKNTSSLTKNTNLFEFIIIILRTIFSKLMVIEHENVFEIENCINVCVCSNGLDLNYWGLVMSNQDERKRLIELGEKFAIDFINIKKETNNISNILTNDLSNNVINHK